MTFQKKSQFCAFPALVAGRDKERVSDLRTVAVGDPGSHPRAGVDEPAATAKRAEAFDVVPAVVGAGPQGGGTSSASLFKPPPPQN